MQNVTVIQGRKIKPTDIQLIQQLLAENPSWGRSRLSLELCQQWNWRRPDQGPKDMACRSLLLKLGRAGQIVLPPKASAKLKLGIYYFRKSVSRFSKNNLVLHDNTLSSKTLRILF